MAYEKTLQQLATDELYVHCPMCDGQKVVYATIHGKGDYITCPTCHGTGDADREKAEEYVRERLEDEPEGNPSGIVVGIETA